MSDEPTKYKFNINIQAPGINKVFQIEIAEDQMQCCPCGSDLFELKYRVTHIKPALLDATLLLEPERLLATPVYVCANPKCRYEVSPQTPTKASMQQLQNVSG